MLFVISSFLAIFTTWPFLHILYRCFWIVFETETKEAVGRSCLKHFWNKNKREGALGIPNISIIFFSFHKFSSMIFFMQNTKVWDQSFLINLESSSPSVMLKCGNSWIWHNKDTSFPWRSWNSVPHLIIRVNWISQTRDHVCTGRFSRSF